MNFLLDLFSTAVDTETQVCMNCLLWEAGICSLTDQYKDDVQDACIDFKNRNDDGC